MRAEGSGAGGIAKHTWPPQALAEALSLSADGFDAAEPLRELLQALAKSANPARARVGLARLLARDTGSAELVRALAARPRLAEVLAALLAGSDYLTGLLVRDASYLQRLFDIDAHTHPRQPQALRQMTLAALATAEGYDAQCDALRRLQRQELLRIGACDLLGLGELSPITQGLAHLADAMVQDCLEIAAREAGVHADALCVLALGKLGGEELNYSSDIDLLFLARSDAHESERVAARVIDALARTTGEGFLYRVDMRLRPWGEAGPLVSLASAYVDYVQRHSRLWERQALLKARPIAGDLSLGWETLNRIAPLLYQVNPEAARADIREMKRRIEAQLRRKGLEWGEVKGGRGSIRDIEFITQFLQLRHGGAIAEVRGVNTLGALTSLRACGLIAEEDYRVLAEGYAFLRPIEHYLQLMHHQQTHTLSRDPDALQALARRLGFDGEDAGAQFLSRYEEHTRAIRAVYDRYLEVEEKRMTRTPDDEARAPEAADVQKVERHMQRMAPAYAAVFTPDEIGRHAQLADRLGWDRLVEVEVVSLPDGAWRVTVVAQDFPGELSLIAGLLSSYGFNIVQGHAFTYEPTPRTSDGSPNAGAGQQPTAAGPRSEGAKIVDAFTVLPTRPLPEDVWGSYRRELEELLLDVRAGRAVEAQARLASRVAEALRSASAPTPVLHPIDIRIDNALSDRYTVLEIDSRDTRGFLYEFTNALALTGHYVTQVHIASSRNRAHDVFYLTDLRGAKVTARDRQQMLRAATVLVKHFTHLLPRSTNPELALLQFRAFIGQLFMRPDWPGELASLTKPDVLEALARLLGVSSFLWDDFLRMQYENLFPVLRDVEALRERTDPGRLRADLAATLAACDDAPSQRAALNAFKDREMFRVDMRHIQGLIREFGEFAAELSDVAEVVVEGAYRLCHERLLARYGEPRSEDGGPCGLCVCALGKFGGREMGYASDVELMFIYRGDGETAGPERISAAEFYNQLVLGFLDLIEAKREGIFEIDLRLRPYGNAGSLAVSLRSFARYFGPDGPAWVYERQALTKLRRVAGDAQVGREAEALRDEFLYRGQGLDPSAVRAMRERQIRHLVRAGTFNAKFSPGGLVDAEYLVQNLQIRYGHPGQALRATNTLEAMGALAEAGFLSQDDYGTLREAYIFLRHLIDALRMVRGNARDLTVPAPGSEDLGFLARRLGYGADVERLRADLTRHTRAVEEMNTRLLAEAASSR